ncbi:transglycosylase SLT domain-containing protein [Nocardia sp. alder85J]|uniref:transglycosylase SLT domain-containing protein n=1 Tax=Nocardia sp. alder85J TaxID=2862949 RepID=UPI001CD4A47B|nr:transglycosylase SLT domain-containing protein [Nocardia sp. alder85J]MCX4096136.1 transglycosylase SLT domain-containing protein [Nocardia sp. alder85J]
MSASTLKTSRVKSAARTAGAGALALAAFAAITSAGGHRSTEVQPVALQSTIAAAADAVKAKPIDDPVTDDAPVDPAQVDDPAPAAMQDPPAAPAPAPAVYSNDLDGWIHQAMDILNARGIPASYDGIYRNVIRESAGDPHAINLWDINAINGIPSKGLLQVIDPTFQTYHVDGTSWDIYDPVANIAAACNYAAARYGSMDNVNSAY